MRVLIVDDAEDLAELAAEALSEHGHSVHVCTTGRGALGWLQRGRGADLVLLDLILPDLDGARFLDAMGEARIHVPVVLFTGATERRIEPLRPRVADVLRKPVHVSDLLRCVRRRARGPARRER